MKTILVIEEDTLVRVAWSSIVHDMGYDIDQASDGLVGLEMLDADKHMMVFCDMNLPHWGGFDVLAKMKKYEYAVPTVMMLPYMDAELRNKALRLGAVDVLYKPVSQQSIETVICRVKAGLVLGGREGIGGLNDQTA